MNDKEPAPKPSDAKGVVGEIAEWAAREHGDAKGYSIALGYVRTLLALHKPLAERREGLAQWFSDYHDARVPCPYYGNPDEVADALIAWLEGGKE